MGLLSVVQCEYCPTQFDLTHGDDYLDCVATGHWVCPDCRGWHLSFCAACAQDLYEG